jgi:hypothetical protein
MSRAATPSWLALRPSEDELGPFVGRGANWNGRMIEGAAFAGHKANWFGIAPREPAC